MRKTVLIVIIALGFGYLIGGGLDRFNPEERTPPYTYTFQTPSGVNEGAAFSDIARVITPTVVNISTSKIIQREVSPFSQFFDNPFGDIFEPFQVPRKWKEQSLGSGVIISDDGYIITNFHVVEKADEIKVTLYDKRVFSGKVIGSDPKTDIAVIKISARNLPAIKWGDADKLQVGEFVLAFGNSFGLSHTVTLGIVSALGRANVGIADYEDFIQTDAAINPGNSGGPLVNIKGELVGINTAIFSRTGGYQGIGFAVPSNMARSVMKQLLKDGKVVRGWLGVTIQDVSQGLAREFGLSDLTGVLVTDIFPGSPAEEAGLNRGDVILEVNDRKVKDVVSLRNMISQSDVGGRLKLKTFREGKEIIFYAAIVELPQEIDEVVPEEPEDEVREEDGLAGFRVMELTSEIAKQLRLSRKERGVIVAGVVPGSAADEAGIKKGDVIQEINKQKVTNLKDFNRIVSHIRDGETFLFFINRSGKKFYVPFKIY
jgi:serine protease Do